MARVRSYGKLVMFSHTLFSLPFALVALCWAANGLPPARVIVWALLALIGARNGANALNRAIDLRFDRANPRTASRVSATGAVSKKETLILSGACFALYFFSAWMLGPACFALSPIPFVLMALYSFAKRFTYLCHIVLGVCCAAAPMGAWLAVTNWFSWAAFCMAGAVCCWVSGFDILYALEDIAFDRKHGLRSVPAKFGRGGAITIAAALHVVALCFLAMIPWLLPLGLLYWVGVGLCAALLALECVLTIRAKGSTDFRVYTINQAVGVCFFAFAMLDFWIGRLV